MTRKKILFVCLGNICRSPAAKAVMQSLVDSEKLSDIIEIDSAGTMGYHTGEPADSRMIKHAAKRNIKINHRARRVNSDKDFEYFDYIIAMDNENYSDLLDMCDDDKHLNKIFKMTDFSDSNEYDKVPDPYYGGPDGFELVLDILDESCKGLLIKVKEDIESENK